MGTSASSTISHDTCDMKATTSWRSGWTTPDGPTSRWVSGSGICRHVWLNTSDLLHVGQWGVYITASNVSATSASLHILTTVRNEYAETKPCTLETTIRDPADKNVANIESTHTIGPGETIEVRQTVLLSTPSLWSVEAPRLYAGRTLVMEGQQVRDDFRTSFGIRDVRFDSKTTEPRNRT